MTRQEVIDIIKEELRVEVSLYESFDISGTKLYTEVEVKLSLGGEVFSVSEDTIYE